MDTSSRKIGRNLFMVVSGLHVLVCYALGLMILINPSFALETGFQINFTTELDIIAIVIGLELLFLGSMALLGIFWTRKNKMSGVTVGTAVGIYMLVFGIVTFFMLGRTDGLIVDSSRGLITIILGYMAYKELK